MKKIIKVLFMSLFVFSCFNEKEKISISDTQNSKDVLNYIKDLGFTENDIAELPDMYIVQKDIGFPKDMSVPKYTTSQHGRVEQRYSSLISFNKQGSIKVKIDQSMSANPNMYFDVTAALDAWNLLFVIGSKIRFTVVTDNTFDVQIVNYNLDNLCGLANLPSQGIPGALVKIDKAEIASLPTSARVATVIHELGHIIGLRHTDSTDGTAVPSVAGSDPNSIMNSTGACQSFGGIYQLSVNDKAATVALYPTEKPYGFYNSGTYPWIFYWQAPIYTGFGSLLGYETKHIRYGYNGSPNVSATTFQTTTNYSLPYVQGQYPGQGTVVYVRAKYSNGSFSDWASYNCTL
jgi:hypothetical protein